MTGIMVLPNDKCMCGKFLNGTVIVHKDGGQDSHYSHVCIQRVQPMSHMLQVIEQQQIGDIWLKDQMCAGRSFTIKKFEDLWHLHEVVMDEWGYYDHYSIGSGRYPYEAIYNASQTELNAKTTDTSIPGSSGGSL